MTDKNEIVLYQPNNSVKLEVRLENETVWLNRQQLALLFDRDIKTIGKHINNALKERANIHDRFLLIDNDIYHIGASLKDLGKKLFAFTKMGMKAEELMRNINFI
ncbi:hypothetical protein FACS189440_02180 [Bacteroidia bacterium]|nr:hypothetical protein FACS189423_02130 [Bacteroidia bacterium]GHT45698.1 hypothetical protein FACS189440_02180 [Bacteroidia bacterium]